MTGGRRDERLLRRSSLARKRRRLPRFVPALAFLCLIGGIVALWIWVFAPLFVEPHEWLANQKRFDRMIREVTRPAGSGGDAGEPTLPDWPPEMSDDQVRLVACAESQVARGVRFSSSYHPLKYPWGDVPEHLGTSADLLVRCVRALGLDLQQMLYLDRKANPRRYPLRLWASRRPDRSIDHRRMPNLYTFAKTYFETIPAGPLGTPEDFIRFQPGDILFWAHAGTQGFPGQLGIVLDRRGPDGVPWVATMVSKERHMTLHHTLTDWPIERHLRLRSVTMLERFLEAHPGAVLATAPAAAPE